MHQILVKLRATAQEQFAHLPQYKGYFDDWSLARVVKGVKLKAGMSAPKHSYVLVKPGNRTSDKGAFLTVWHDGWMCAASVKESDIEIVANG